MSPHAWAILVRTSWRRTGRSPKQSAERGNLTELRSVRCCLTSAWSPASATSIGASPCGARGSTRGNLCVSSTTRLSAPYSKPRGRLCGRTARETGVADSRDMGDEPCTAGAAGLVCGAKAQSGFAPWANMHGLSTGVRNASPPDYIDRPIRNGRPRGAQFLTEPKDRGREIRAYIRDPDGHLIEVGQISG